VIHFLFFDDQLFRFKTQKHLKLRYRLTWGFYNILPSFKWKY